MQPACSNCGAPLTGEYCSACGQRRVRGRLTLGALFSEVFRRVLYFDKAFGGTFWRMLHEPGRLVPDYLAGRRVGILDPIQYLSSSAFLQVAVASFTHFLAPVVGRVSAVGWLSRLGGVMAIKVLIIFGMGFVWRLLFRPLRYNLAEIYVFAMYAFATTGILWAILPLVDLLVPFPLGADPLTVTLVTLGIEIAYGTYAIWQFGNVPIWRCALRVTAVLGTGYALLIGVVGPGYLSNMLLPANLVAH